jgi:AAA15 family ATPase/GTPase
MLTKWGLRNFKSIYHANLDLAPLTVLTGTNSSGKSSLLQSMLVISQTIQNKMSSRGLVLNGPLIKMGTFEDVLSFDGKSIDEAKKNIYFDIGISCNDKAQENTEYTESFVMTIGKNVFNAMNSIIKKYAREKMPEFLFGGIDVSVRLITNVNCGISFVHKKDKLDPVVKKSKLEFFYKNNENKFHSAAITVLLFADKYIITNIFEIDKELLSNLMGADRASLNHFLPATFTGFSYAKKFHNFLYHFYDLVPQLLALMFENKDIYKTDVNARKAAVDELLSLVERKIPKEITKKDEEAQEIKSTLLTKANEFVENYFENKFLYLGPLRFREPVSPVSILPNPKDVGISGEYTAQVIYYFKEQNVKYIPVKNGVLAVENPKEDKLNVALEH